MTDSLLSLVAVLLPGAPVSTPLELDLHMPSALATISSVTLLQGELNGLLALKGLTDQFHYFRINYEQLLFVRYDREKNVSKPTHFYSRLKNIIM